jgi:hypothetical protein
VEIDKILSRNSVWDLGNSWLYKLFETYPKNKKSDEIVAKVWILGRCYAAAVERRKIKDNLNNDAFYKSKVIKAIQSAKIDEGLATINSEKDEVNKMKAKLKLHKDLQKELRCITGHDKRSFSSKYLHFHMPKEFYIYDTRAVDALRMLPKEYKISRREIKAKLGNHNFDKVYAQFFCKCEFAKSQITKTLNRPISIREYDTILLDLINQQKERNKT